MLRPILAYTVLLWICAALAGCSSTYPGLPDLPEKDWLQQGEVRENSRGETLLIYAPDKTLGIDDLVWIAVQESPVISRGRVNLDIQEINKRDAKWKYIPELHLQYTISSNITRYNDSEMGQYQDSKYGETAYQLNFSGYFNNPVSTFFSVKAADELLRVAIVTQRKAIAQVIFQIAGSLLSIDLWEEAIASLESSLYLARKRAEAVAIRTRTETNIYNPLSSYEDNVRETELRIQEHKLDLMTERANLKRIIGLGPEQALKVDAKSVYALIDKFDMSALDWKDIWKRTEDNYLLRQQVRLEQANIMLAWAQYLPSINFAINESAPNGQSQPVDAKTDQFLHLTFDFPILDWGHRWRQAESAAARQRQRMLDEVQREREYGDSWQKLRQDVLLAQTRLERARLSAKNAAKRREIMEIASSSGNIASFVNVADAGQQEIEKNLELLRASRALAQSRLNWIHAASGLSNHYLGNAGYEEARQ